MATESTEGRLAPGPRGGPLYGSVFDAWRDPLGLLMKGAREYGDIVRFRFGPHRYFLLSDPESIKHVFVDNHKNYIKSRNYDGLRLVLGKGLITSEGELWRRQRKLAQPAFHRDRLANFARTMVALTDDMLARWSARPDPTAPLDVHDEMMRLTFRIVGKTLFGADVEGQATSVGEALGIVTHFAQEYAESLVSAPLWLPTLNNRRFRAAAHTLDRLVHGILNERRGAAAQRDDLLGMLLSARDEGGEGMSDEQLRDEITSLVLAGHETTANALSWAFYLLSKHPEVERRLYEEAQRVLGEATPTLDDLPKLSFCANFVSEVMRLYPPVWTFERDALDDDVVLGFHIPKGAIVAVSPYVLHRHPRYWDNPEGFDPDRFTTERSEGRPRYAYVPFGVGPRMCIGNHFALMEAQLIVTAVVQRYRLLLVPWREVELDPVITLRPKHGIWVTARHRSPPPGVDETHPGTESAAA